MLFQLPYFLHTYSPSAKRWLSSSSPTADDCANDHEPKCPSASFNSSGHPDLALYSCLQYLRHRALLPLQCYWLGPGHFHSTDLECLPGSPDARHRCRIRQLPGATRHLYHRAACAAVLDMGRPAYAADRADYHPGGGRVAGGAAGWACTAGAVGRTTVCAAVAALPGARLDDPMGLPSRRADGDISRLRV
jgi:hypothetical protein